MKNIVLMEATSSYQKKYKCPYCDGRFERSKLHIHIQDQHEELIPEGYTALRVAFNTINNKTEGHCIICKGVTDWNEDKGRYERLCNNPKCHEAYKAMVASRTKNKYGTDRLQSDPRYAEEVQKKALEGRKISGKYKFTDGGIINYVGTYEKKFLEFCDKVMNMESIDFQEPGPAIEYMWDGAKHLYLPDFYYVPYNLIIEIKDGGDNPNKNPEMQTYKTERQKAKEDAVRDTRKYNYIRLTNNQFAQFMGIMADIKYQMKDGCYDPIMMINESTLLESSDEDRDEFVRKIVAKNLSGMRTSEIDTQMYNFFIFKYKDGTEHKTETGETPGEIRDIRDTHIACEMSIKEYKDRKSGKSKEDEKAIEKADKLMEERIKKYGKDAGAKSATLGIPHASKAISLIRLPNKSYLNEFALLESSNIYLSSLKKVTINSNLINKEPALKHIRIGNNCSGYAFYKDSDLVCFINIEEKENGQVWIQGLEVIKEFQNQGLGRQLLDFACKDNNAKYLSVNKKNTIAINMYKKYGFKTYDETSSMYFMKLDSTLNEATVESYSSYDLNTDKGKELMKSSRKSVDDEFLSMIDGEVLVDDSNGKVIGYINIMKSNKCINMLYVMRHYRRKGFGKLLLDDAVKKYGAKSLWVDQDNFPAVGMYTNKGFEPKYRDKSRRMYYMELNESTLNESYIINEKDIYYNKDKFDSGEINLCFITGHSGSGKSTMARNMEKSEVENYSLDDLQTVKDHFTMSQLKEYGDLIYSYFNGEGKKFYITFDELKERNLGSNEYEDILFPGFVHYAMKYAKSHKDKKFVIEGVWLYGNRVTDTGKLGSPWFTPEEFKDYAFYIKGTSMLISKIREAKRDSRDEKTAFKKFREFHKLFLISNWKFYFLDEKRIKVFRDYFKRLEPMNEITENMGGVIGAALPLTPSPIPYESDKDNYYIIQHPQNNVFNYSITKDPIQYQMYSIDPEHGYKVTQTDKGKFHKSYLTFKVKDHNTAKAAYEELKKLCENNISAPSADYVYTLCTGHRVLTEDQLLYDDKLELVNNWYDKIQEQCDILEDYLINGITEETSISAPATNVNGEMNNTDVADEYFHHDWNNKLLKIRSVESEGIIIMIDSSSDKFIDEYDQENIDRLNEKWNKFQSSEDEYRELYDTTATSILGISNYNLYYKILSKFAEVKDNSDNRKSVSSVGTSDIGMSPYFTREEVKKHIAISYDKIKTIAGIDVANFRNNYIRTGNLSVSTEAWANALTQLSVSMEFAKSDSRIKAVSEAMISLGWNPEIRFTNEVARKTWSRHTTDTINEVNLTQFYLNESLNGSEMELTEAYTSSFLKNKIVPVFVVLTDLDLARNKAIKFATHSEWSHASFTFKSDLSEVYSFANNGFTEESRALYMSKNPNAKMKLYALFITPEQKKSIKKVIDWYIANKEKTSYNLNNALSIALRKSGDDSDNTRMICSQFVYSLLKIVDFKLSEDKNPSSVTPGDLDNLSNDARLFSMYKGYLDGYNSKIVNKLCYDMLPTLPMDMYGLHESNESIKIGTLTLREFIETYRGNSILKYLRPTSIIE